MIKKFDQFVNELVTAQDMQKNLDLGMEKTEATPPDKNPPIDADTQKQANLKVTDIQGRINQINQQKKLINQEIINLQAAQRDLMPNNPTDPKNGEKQRTFMEDQKEKINIQQQKLKVLDDEVKNLQKQIAQNQQKYL